MNSCSHLPGPAESSARPVLFADCRLVLARGELDLTTMTPLAENLRRARAGTGRPCLIVDLSAVTFADGSILEPLCEAWDECRARRGWARVVYTRPSTALVFRAGGLAGRFPGYASAQDAWQGVIAGPAPRLERGGSA
ncbi:STAS domain-containing protein [Streptomyces sp. SID8379]|uniref:STAS domain-containing protein n=1 Tax=unclassified Streptomyces TaxID=2593676 RepID=UPI0003820EC7|nr:MULTISPECIES: STAS domain-containing protein [unclassified Streptomyces]MYW65816.1 STAS domain-containing protein [Streptomyces sp. SID8379]